MQGKLSGVRNVRLIVGRLRGVAVREKNGALAEREQFAGRIWCGDADSVGVVAKRPIIELCKFPDATLDAGADGRRPENTMLAKLQLAIPSLRQKFYDRFIGDARQEKDVVKVALAGKLRLPLGQSCVLDEFAGRERTQGYHWHAGIFREGFQGFRGCGQPLRDGNAGKAAEAQRPCLPRL